MTGGLTQSSAPDAEPEALADARRFNLPPADIDRIARSLRRPLSAGAGVWPVNVPIVMAFLSMSSQWRTGLEILPNGRPRMLWLGLDYTAAQAALALAGLSITPQQWRGVRIIELAAREALNNGA